MGTQGLFGWERGIRRVWEQMKTACCGSERGWEWESPGAGEAECGAGSRRGWKRVRLPYLEETRIDLRIRNVHQLLGQSHVAHDALAEGDADVRHAVVRRLQVELLPVLREQEERDALAVERARGQLDEGRNH
jgi:hypothetical protein